MKHDMQPFVEGCAAMKIDLSKSQLADFEAYLSLLLEWRSKMNLTAIRDQGNHGTAFLGLHISFEAGYRQGWF